MLAKELVKYLCQRRFSTVIPTDYYGRTLFDRDIDIFKQAESFYVDV